MSEAIPCWQPSLLDGGASGLENGEVSFDPSFAGLVRDELDHGAWVDRVPGWVRGADVLFDLLLTGCGWQQHTMWMYEQRVTEPRLTVRYDLADDELPAGLLAPMAEALSAHYGVTFTQVGANLYRDGTDSVAWHGDRVARELEEATVALVCLGQPRPFRLRPRGGGRSLRYLPGRGDLLVMGGSCQRTWEHSVPKVRVAGPRMSVQFRHAYER